MQAFIDLFAQAQQTLFEGLVQPVLFGTGLGNLLEDGYAATGWLLVGLLQITVLLTLVSALQRWRPVQAITDRAAVQVDVIYTLIHRLGLFRVALFFTLDPLWTSLIGHLRVAGLPAWSLDLLWPGVTDGPVVSFMIYLLLFDAVDYAIHRGEHRFNWWWQLHAVHHSQRQMTMWSDNRNHLLSDVIRDSIFVLVALLVGIAPSQFVAVVAVTQLVESLSHANVRLHFGRWGSRLLVSPQFHRLHHRMGEPVETQGAAQGAAPATGGFQAHNYAVLFPVWDMLFGSARFGGGYPATGVQDQLQGRDYGRGFWAQQWLGLMRLAGRA